MITLAEFCEQYPLAPDAPREAYWQRSDDYQRLRRAEEFERLTAEHDRTRAAVADVAELDLLISLIRFIDREHESDTSYCRPAVPDDCSPYCRACEALRGVRDDVLLAARAQAKLEELP